MKTEEEIRERLKYFKNQEKESKNKGNYDCWIDEIAALEWVLED